MVKRVGRRLPRFRMIARACCLVVSVAMTMPGTLAQAQQRDPRELEAKTACLAGRSSRGIELLAQLYAETNDPTYIYNQGRCFEQDGKLREAVTRFREYLRKAPAMGPEENTQVRARIAELESQLNAPAPPAPAVAPAAATPPPAAIPPNASDSRGEQSGPSVGEAPVPVAQEDSSRALRVAGIASAGVGALAIVGAIYMHGRAVDLSDQVTTAAEKGQPWKSLYDEGQRAERWQWVGYSVGTVALLAGGAMYFLGGRHQGEPTGERTVAVSVVPIMGASAGMRAGLRIVF